MSYAFPSDSVVGIKGLVIIKVLIVLITCQPEQDIKDVRGDTVTLHPRGRGALDMFCDTLRGAPPCRLTTRATGYSDVRLVWFTKYGWIVGNACPRIAELKTSKFEVLLKTSDVTR